MNAEGGRRKAAGAALLLLVATGCTAHLDSAVTPPLYSERHRGVSWVASEERFEADQYYTVLKDHHVNWIVQTPFGWQRGVDTPSITTATDERVMWGERDEGLVAIANRARKHEIKTLLKPHIWITRGEGKWRSDIEMASDADWDAWFTDYTRFIMHYARLAEANDFPALCIGTELRKTLAHDERWAALIGEIRAVYSGQLTYAANWWMEFEEVPFWDELDFIGIQAYFPIADGPRPKVSEMTSAWQPHLERIRALQRRHAKPVVFTEIGYRNTPDNAVEPWLWPAYEGFESFPEGGIPDPNVQIDHEAQADSFSAMFEVFWDEPWFQGTYVWKWHPAQLNGRGEPELLEGFSPQGAPAMDVIGEWYGRP